ncbi:MAG: ATP-binding protein [Acidobacteriota bacterium]
MTLRSRIKSLSLFSLRSIASHLSDFEVFRKQESSLILLNLAVLASLFLVHILFFSLLGAPSKLLLLVLTARFLSQVFELFWLQSLKAPLSARVANAYSQFSILINLAFAFLASNLGGLADSHYWVLMVLPIISAAFRFGIVGTFGVVAVAVSLTFLQVWLYFKRRPPTDISEYFEAATVALIFIVIALVVRLLVGYLRHEQAALKRSLAELHRTKDLLVAEEKLAAVGRLSSAIAHEIRNPVAMISSSLAMARQPSANHNLREEMFEIAGQEATRLEKLTTDFLAYARVKEPQRKPVSVGTTLHYIASLVKARAAKASIHLEVDCPVDLMATIDDFQIQQALLNLALNATEATPQNGNVIIGARAGSNHELNIYVENSGTEVGSEVQARIFEPFFTTKPEGTGLGLAIARNIARAHGGELSLAINETGRVRFLLAIPDAARLSSSKPGGVSNGAHSNR